MPRYLLEFAVVLAVAALGSAIVYAIDVFRQHKPTRQDGYNSVYEVEELEGPKDPFDVVSPEDYEDGEPLDEQHFWGRVSKTGRKNRASAKLYYLLDSGHKACHLRAARRACRRPRHQRRVRTRVERRRSDCCHTASRIRSLSPHSLRFQRIREHYRRPLAVHHPSRSTDDYIRTIASRIAPAAS